jgi:PAS domain S-box-containing protein
MGVELERIFPGDSQMARRIRSFDWSLTELGPPEPWPQNLKTCVRIILASRQPMFVWWGERLINLYNDGYAAFLYAKHPAALGGPASAVWPEIWDQVGPRVESAMRGNEGTYDEALPFIMYRKGYPEETYVTFSYSPISNDYGTFGGILCPVTEETQRIIDERQLALLHELDHKTGHAGGPKEACTLAASALETNPYDLPFALIYAIDADTRVASLAGTAGMLPWGNRAAPVIVTPDTPCLWPLDQVSRSRRSTVISDLTSVLDELPTVRGRHALAQAVVMPLPDSSESRVADVLVVGLNPLRLFDDAYQRFLDLVAARISFAVSKSQTYEALRHSEQILAAEVEAGHRLQGVATQLMDAKGVEGLYEQILDTAMAIVDSDFASIQMFYPERGAHGELRLLGHRGFSAEAAKRWEWVRPTTKTTCGEVLRTRQRVAVPDVRECDFMAGSADLEGYLSAGIHAVQTTPLVSGSGALVGMVSTHWCETHELTPTELRAIDVLARLAAELIERSRTEEKLRASEARLTETERLTKVGGWDRHINTGQSYWSEEIRKIFGVPNDAPTGLPAFVARVHPSDREMILELERKVHSTMAPVETEYRIIRPNGGVRYVRSVVQAIRNDRGEPVRLAGATQDVTEQVQTRDLLRQSEERLKNAERLASLGHWQWNLKSNQIIWSEECFRIFGQPRNYTPSYEDFFRAVVPEDRELLERGGKRTSRGESRKLYRASNCPARR